MVRHQGEEAPQPGRTGKWLNTAEGWARANVLYEKTYRPPKAGSLKEALFLSVWLRRQEVQVLQVRILAQGLSDLAAKEGSKSPVADIFKEYTETIFPFMKGEQASKDAAMKAMMQREVGKGMITFKPADMSFLHRKAQTMATPDDYKKKLAAKAALKGKK